MDLSEHTESLAREITPPGEQPPLRDDQLLGYLTDAFWEARLDGFFPKYRVDDEGIVEPEGFPREYVALCVIYAGGRILRLRISNLEAEIQAVAGPVEFRLRQSVSVLKELLQQLERRKDQLLGALSATDAHLIDALTVRTLSLGSYSGWVD